MFNFEIIITRVIYREEKIREINFAEFSSFEERERRSWWRVGVIDVFSTHVQASVTSCFLESCAFKKWFFAEKFLFSAENFQISGDFLFFRSFLEFDLGVVLVSRAHH